MVKGVSRQVIVVNSPDKALFDQAIFILKENALQKGGVSDDALLREARRLISRPQKRTILQYGPVWACGGALATGLLWLLTAVV